MAKGIASLTRQTKYYLGYQMSNVELEHLINQDVYLFIEKGVCGTISGIRNRFRKANNAYVPDYFAKEETFCIRDVRTLKVMIYIWMGYVTTSFSHSTSKDMVIF